MIVLFQFCNDKYLCHLNCYNFYRNFLNCFFFNLKTLSVLKLFDKSIYEPFLVLMCPDCNGYTRQVICLKTATISLSASASSYPHGVYAEQICHVIKTLNAIRKLPIMVQNNGRLCSARPCPARTYNRLMLILL